MPKQGTVFSQPLESKTATLKRELPRYRNINESFSTMSLASTNTSHPDWRTFLFLCSVTPTSYRIQLGPSSLTLRDIFPEKWFANLSGMTMQCLELLLIRLTKRVTFPCRWFQYLLQPWHEFFISRLLCPLPVGNLRSVLQIFLSQRTAVQAWRSSPVQILRSPSPCAGAGRDLTGLHY